MFINSINNFNISPVKSKNISHKGINPVVERNQMKILLSQDIYTPKLKVKLPESPLEKEVLLEILKHRLNLEKLTRLCNEKFTTNINIDRYNELVEVGEATEEFNTLKKEIAKKGNLSSYYKTINKQIELEKKKHQSSLDYFNDIKETEEEYIQKKLISEGKINKFFEQIRKNNINKDEEYSTKELISVIESGELKTKNKTQNNVKLTTSELLKQVKNTYENYLKEAIDIYGYEEGHWKKSQQGKLFVEEKFKNHLKNDPDLAKKFAKIYKEVEEKYTKYAYKLENVRYLDIAPFWNYLKELEEELLISTNKMNELKSKLTIEKDNSELKNEIIKNAEKIEEIREEWLKYMIESVRMEADNYKTMEEAGIAKEYSYLVERHKDLNKYTSIFRVYKQNNDSIPEEFWSEILNVSKS